MAVRELLADVNVLYVPLAAAIGGGVREMIDWVRGRRGEAAQAARSDMEVGKALRDELIAMIELKDKECQRRLDAMELHLKEVQSEADAAREEAKSLREQLEHAEKTIAALKRQIAALTKKQAG